MEALQLYLLVLLSAGVGGQLQVSFFQIDYGVTESERVRSVTILKEDVNVGSLTLRVVPLTFDQFFNGGNVLPDELMDRGLPDPAEFDVERRDFSNVIQMVTFPPSSTEELRNLNITVFDDLINEATEGYLLMLEVVEAMSDPQDIENLQFVNGGTSLIVILDNDDISLGFEQTQFTVREDSGLLSGVSVIKENAAITEQNLTFLLRSVDGTAMEGPDYQGTAGESFSFTLLPAEQSIPIPGISIVNDDIPEGEEQFLLQLSRPTGAPFDLGDSVAFINIVDDDIVVVGFERALYSVGEGDGVVEVCVVLDDAGEFSPGSIILNVVAVAGSAEATTDFIPPPFAVVAFPSPIEPFLRVCVNIQIQDDAQIEPTEEFELQLLPFPGVMLPPNVIRRPNTTTVRIIDDDVPPQPGNTTSCSVFDSLMVSPFQTSNSYSFSDTCEHFLVSSCNGLVEFAVTVDFLSANISNGRIGVRYGERRFVYQEDGTIDTRGEVPINIDGNTAEYEGQIFITEDANGIVLQFQSVGVEIFITSAAFEMNVNLFSPLGTTCGLCGTQEGVLLYSDQQTTADIANEAQVRGFVASHLVPARDHFLRGVRRECAVLTNDTLVGDPLYAVPFAEDGTSLCFEVHGAALQYFNLISDTCTNVNAFYAPVLLPNDGRNFVEEIGVRAVGSSGSCYNIRVYESVAEGFQCVATIDNATVGPGGVEVDGIRVRRIMDRVRISVPNCENVNLVMWVTCELRNGLRMLRFDVSRGLNLRPTAHGLIGQFWNIPIAYDPNSFNGTLSNGYDSARDVRIVTVSPVDGSPSRQFLAERRPRTWTKSPHTCLYAGNGQGGRSGAGQPDDSVIQGRYSDYAVSGLFQHEFRFAQFENDRCLQ